MSALTSRGPLGRRTDRKTGNVPLGRSSQMKNLLSEEEADVVREIKFEPQKAVGSCPVDAKSLLDKLTIDIEEYVYPRVNTLPEDYYFSTIAGMSARSKNDKVILDVDYDLEDRNCEIHHIRQSYPIGSQPYYKLCAALVAAGLSKSQHITEAVGTTEIVRVGYHSKNSDLGSIVERKPYVMPPEDDDSEYDDFLEDSEE